MRHREVLHYGASMVALGFGWNAVLFASMPLTIVAIIALGLLKTPSHRYHHRPESR